MSLTLCARCLLEQVQIFPIFFFETQNFKVPLKPVAFDLEDGFGTIGKLFLYSF